MTKYAGQLQRAQALIKRKGSNTIKWIQSPPDPNDNTEYPPNLEPVETLVDMAFYPLTRLNELTGSFDTGLDIPSANWAGIMAGGQPFTPRIGDTVKFPDDSTHTVIYINTTAPDMTPLVYEVYMT